jgi:hypothetical protein
MQVANNWGRLGEEGEKCVSLLLVQLSCQPNTDMNTFNYVILFDIYFLSAVLVSVYYFW